MKATGVVRKVDELGRVVLPKELRRTYGIDEGDALEMNHVQLTVKRKNLHALIESMIDSGAEFHVRREGAR